MTRGGHLTSLSLREARDGVRMLPAFLPACSVLPLGSPPAHRRGVGYGDLGQRQAGWRGHAQPSRAQRFPVWGPPHSQLLAASHFPDCRLTPAQVIPRGCVRLWCGARRGEVG